MEDKDVINAKRGKDGIENERESNQMIEERKRWLWTLESNVHRCQHTPFQSRHNSYAAPATLEEEKKDRKERKKEGEKIKEKREKRKQDK